jgi:hypothetical protein
MVRQRFTEWKNAAKTAGLHGLHTLRAPSDHDSQNRRGGEQGRHEDGEHVAESLEPITPARRGIAMGHDHREDDLWSESNDDVHRCEPRMAPRGQAYRYGQEEARLPPPWVRELGPVGRAAQIGDAAGRPQGQYDQQHGEAEHAQEREACPDERHPADSRLLLHSRSITVAEWHVQHEQKRSDPRGSPRDTWFRNSGRTVLNNGAHSEVSPILDYTKEPADGLAVGVVGRAGGPAGPSPTGR